MNGLICPCCPKKCRDFFSLYNHLQLIHRWDYPPHRKSWHDKTATKNPSNEDIKKYLDEVKEK